MEPRTLTYRKPWLFRAVFVFVSLVGATLIFAMWSDIASRPHPDYSVLPMGILLFGGESILFSWLSGPDDIDFDLEQKTYRHTKGPPFFAKTRTGPVSDFWGVYVGRTRGDSRYFCVGVTWWGGKGSVTLERFNNKASAERFAAMLMSNLELKQVMPPRNLRPLA
jgi:hypothetical protein